MSTEAYSWIIYTQLLSMTYICEILEQWKVKTLNNYIEQFSNTSQNKISK